ncbi:MAG: helix-turn-helix transcriptional regulator [Actinobacteria bacterium]|nr:helix-turn-helix transcriptional regulator [Actinomycetota bacterium]
MEVLDERWTLLIIRELLSGSRHFNELRRGVPRMSPSLLSQRLRTLTRAGIVERREDRNRVSYELTTAGEELRPVVEALGGWGIRWIGELGVEDLDPHLLLWDMHRNLNIDAMPDGRIVLAFVFPDVARPADRWWLVVDGDEVDVCDVDPGHPVDVTVTGGLATMTRIWRGDIEWDAAVGAGSLELTGAAHLRRVVRGWLRLSGFAAVPRPT